MPHNAHNHIKFLNAPLCMTYRDNHFSSFHYYERVINTLETIRVVRGSSSTMKLCIFLSFKAVKTIRPYHDVV